jgi:hypothetical protein
VAQQSRSGLSPAFMPANGFVQLVCLELDGSASKQPVVIANRATLSRTELIHFGQWAPVGSGSRDDEGSVDRQQGDRWVGSRSAHSDALPPVHSPDWLPLLFLRRIRSHAIQTVDQSSDRVFGLWSNVPGRTQAPCKTGQKRAWIWAQNREPSGAHAPLHPLPFSARPPHVTGSKSQGAQYRPYMSSEP